MKVAFLVKATLTACACHLILGARQTHVEKSIRNRPHEHVYSYVFKQKTDRLKIDHVYTAVKKNESFFDCVIHTTQ